MNHLFEKGVYCFCPETKQIGIVKELLSEKFWCVFEAQTECGYDRFSINENDLIYIENHCNVSKILLPDEVVTRKDLFEYLDIIGYKSNMWLLDCDPSKLLELFNNSQSDAHQIECSDFEKLNKDWVKYCANKNHKKSPFKKI